MRTAISSLELLTPRTVGDALRMLRDEEGVVPLAGATDLYVSLNFGTLESRRFVNLWGCDRSVTSACRVTRWSSAPWPRTRRSFARVTCNAACPCWSRPRARSGRADPESRNPRRQHRQPSPAGDTLPVLAADAVVVLRSVEERRVRFSDFYTAPAEPASPRRAHQRGRDRADRRHPVVPQSRHPRGPGDIQGGHGRRALPRRASPSAAWHRP